MNTRTILAPIALALLSAAASMPSSARAEPAGSATALIIDCHGTDGLPTWAASEHWIQVDLKVDGVWERSWGVRMTGGRCAADITSYPRDNILIIDDHDRGWTAIQGIRLTIEGEGTDALFVDKITLATQEWNPDNLIPHWTWGINNNVGYCLSKDPSDGENAHCTRNRAYTSWEFVR